MINNAISYPYRIICVCVAGPHMFYTINNPSKHAEMNMATNFDTLTRKNTTINLTNYRVRLNMGVWEFSLSAPCKHCQKSLSNYEKKLKTRLGRGTRINIRWSVSNEFIVLTLFKNINDDVVRATAKISSGNAKKLNKWDQYNIVR